ncbi:hypothetical protein VNO77_08460 [Canavalia gladiata]|uniref:Uncharacterized protein n=1 Tax=Canavalia gladiata TaxID=3824 RepID=A0AAN9M9C6_CANGL
MSVRGEEPIVRYAELHKFMLPCAHTCIELAKAKKALTQMGSTCPNICKGDILDNLESPWYTNSLFNFDTLEEPEPVTVSLKFEEQSSVPLCLLNESLSTEANLHNLPDPNVSKHSQVIRDPCITSIYRRHAQHVR